MVADHVLALIGGAVLVLGLSSRIVKAHSLSPMALALVLGVVAGPHVLGVVDPTAELPRGKLLEELCRVALAFAVFDIALRIQPDDLRRNLRRVVVLLLVVMPGMWLLSSAGAWLLLDFPFTVALVVGAALTPTDPGVASALVTGVMPNRSLPRRVRSTLQLEAAANDGLALPFVLLAGSLAVLPAGEALGEWAPEAGRALGIAVVVGALVGLLFHRLVDVAGVHRLAEEDWFPLASGGLAIAVLGLAHLLGGSGVFGVFVAGLVFSEGLPENLRQPIHTVHRSLTKVAVVVVLLAFGAVVPIDEWRLELGVAGLAFAAWVLVLRRLPVAVPTMLLAGGGAVSSLYLGWSGPLGVAGIYYLAYAERFGLAEYERLFAAGSLAVTVSVIAHTLSSSVAVRAYRRRTGRAAPEGEELRLPGPLLP